MAERRMFAKTIIDSDAFLDMPLSSQSLYFHLSMRADDDGFINNPRKIQRMIGASDDDLKLLITKKFIIPFESGIVVIKHWKIHNYIRIDRYKETVYQEEKAQLAEKDNKAYTLDTPCQPLGIPDDNQCETQIRIGKDSIVKESIEEREVRARTDFQQIAEMYNTTCPSLPSVKTLSDARKKAIKARLNTYSLDDFRTLFEKAEASDFLKGSNERNWTATFDWLIKDANMAKVLEGNFDSKPRTAKGKPSIFQPKHDYDAIARMKTKKLREKLKTAANDEEVRARAEALQKQLQG